MKKIFFAFLFLSLLLLVPLKVHAEEVKFYNIKTSVGVNATSAGINYHASVSGSKVQLSTSSTFNTYTELTPGERTFEKGATNNEDRTIFPSRYVCTLDIGNLLLNTTYYYRIVKDDTYSKTCSFRTAKTTKTTFGVLCDTQSSGSSFLQSDELVKKLVQINPDINFFMIAGDIVDRGGYEDQWDYFDQNMPYFNSNYLQATVPGNHELYHSSLASYEDASIYNVYYNNPKNGVAKRLNSSYYFIYNDILFIMLDTMNRSNGDSQYEEQNAWFKQVVENNKHSFLIVVTHPGCYSAGAYSGDAQIMTGHWRSLFEEYGVDLAISGHEHIYLRTKKLYENKVDNSKGVTYVIGGCAGTKRYSGTNNPELFEVLLESDNPSGHFCGSIVEIEGDTLSFKYYDMYGNLRDSFSIETKNKISSSFDVNEFLNNISVRYDDKTRRNYIVWPNDAYGHLKYVDINIEHLNANLTKFIGPASNEVAVGIGTPTRDYRYNCVFTDYEGHTYEKVIEVHNDTDSYRPKDMKLQVTETSKGNYTFDATYDDNGWEQVRFELIVSGKTYRFDQNNHLEVELPHTLSEDDITLHLVYEFFGSADESTFTKDNMTITLNHTKDEDKSSGGCKFGFVALMPLLALSCISVILFKRKH